MGTYGKGAGGVAGGSPAPAAVKTEAFVGNDLEDATTLEGLGVCLSLDLEDVEGKKNNLSNTNQTKGVVSAAAAWGAWSITHLPAVECMMALPVFLPKAFSKSLP